MSPTRSRRTDPDSRSRRDEDSIKIRRSTAQDSLPSRAAIGQNAIDPVMSNLTLASLGSIRGERSAFIDPLASFTVPGQQHQQLLSLHQLRQRRSQLLRQQQEERYIPYSSLSSHFPGDPFVIPLQPSLHQTGLALPAAYSGILLNPALTYLNAPSARHSVTAALLQQQEEAMALAAINQQQATSAEFSLIHATANDIAREAAEREEARRRGRSGRVSERRRGPTHDYDEEKDEPPDEKANENEDDAPCFSHPYKREAWDVMYERLLQYKEKHGDCAVPQDFKEIPKLGNWVQKQRTLKKSNKLAPDRVERLDAADFIWRVQESWEHMYDLLKEFKVQHGHCDVPKHYDANPKLGKWVRVQRMRRKVLSEERRELLKNIGLANFW